MLGYGSADHGSDRKIKFEGVSKQASGNTDETQSIIAVRTGYNFKLAANHTLSTIAEVSHVNVDIDAYTETGAGNYNFSFDDQTAQSTLAKVGMESSLAFVDNQQIIVPSVSISWSEEISDGKHDLSGRFDGSKKFRVDSHNNSDGGYATFGAGVIAQLSDSTTSVALNLQHDNNFDDFKSSHISASLNIKW
jgi:uncharacterized protein YhjY with autotransporter beta-barrel domain